MNLFDIEEMFPGDGVGSGRLPRKQSGNAPQELTAILMADYTFPARVWLPSAAIVTLLGEFGVAEGAARTTISRLARRGALEGRRQGRHSSYRLTEETATDLWNGGGSIAAFTTHSDSWDGYWTLITFSVPEEHSTRRRALRTALRWRGYAPLYDAVWVSPHPLPPKGHAELAALAHGKISVFRAQHLEVEGSAGRNPVQAWDVRGITGQYQAFIRRWRGLIPRIAAGGVTGAAAVRARAEVMNSYRRFPVLDPLLPIDLLPSGWPRARAREVCVAVYDGLAQPGQEHVRAVVAQYDEESRPDILAHTIAAMSSGINHS
ncbi:PaaX family transcriptional regulator C-terminal domain-containing protein [Streptomyces sp. ID05-26A]|nr:PaaX family transcriptional regulator C-terminal domain-containing protein [Streptomyces sp. ID05-26A]